MPVRSNSHIPPKMEKTKTRSMSDIKSKEGDSLTRSTPSGLRRVTSLSGWPRQRNPKETQRGGDISHTNSGSSSSSGLRRSASKLSRIFRADADTDPNQKCETLSEDNFKGKEITRRPSMVRLRRIASKSSRIFRTNIDSDPIQNSKTHANGGTSSSTKLRRMASRPSRVFRTNIETDPIQSSETLCEDQFKSKEIKRRASVVRLRRMASMPGRSLKNMANRSVVPSQGAAPTEGKRLSRMKSWSGSVKSGSTRWFGLSKHGETGKSRLEESGAPTRGTRPTRRVHFATAELRPNFGSESSEEDNLSSYHVSLLPSRRHVEEYRDSGERRNKWWSNDEYYAALAMPIF